jgi:hypothetical protein
MLRKPQKPQSFGILRRLAKVVMLLFGNIQFGTTGSVVQ